MKSTINMMSLLVLLMLGLSVKAKAQTFTLTNNLHCSVEIFYEARNLNCFTPSSGPVTINPMSSVTMTAGPNIIGGCLVIRQIGGVTAPGNHLWITMNSNFAPCHNVSSGQTGVTANCGAYSVTLTSNSWTIN